MSESVSGQSPPGDLSASGRTALALDRTLMASTRTSVSMICFGFTIAKFFQELKSIEHASGAIETLSSHNIGFWMVVIGTVYMLASAVQYILLNKQMHIEGTKKKTYFILVLSFCIVLLGLILAISFYSNFLSLDLDR